METSLYDIVNTRKDNLLNTGFDYENQIFARSLSSTILNDSTRAGILSQIETMIYFLIQKTKMIKNYYNYTVDKEYSKLR